MNFKLVFNLLFLFVGAFFVHAQDSKRHKDMAATMCECLQNEKEELTVHNFEKKYLNCKSSAVLVGLLSGITEIKKDTTVNINMDEVTGNLSSDSITEDDMIKVNDILKRDCEIFSTNLEKIETYAGAIGVVVDSSCKCVEQIPTDIPIKDKNSLIKECTTQAISDNNIRAQIELNTVEQIRAFNEYVSNSLINNCEAVKTVTFSSDEEKLYSYSSNEKALKEYDKGIDAFEQNDFKKAIKHYKKAVKIDDKFVFAWDNLGRSYRMNNQYDKAIQSYEKSYSIDPLNPTAIMNMAAAYNLKKDANNAAKWYNKLIKIDKEDPEGFYGLAITYMNVNRLEESLENCIIAYKLYEKQGSPYTTDAKRVMNYLKGLFEKEDQLALFEKICAKNDITVD